MGVNNGTNDYLNYCSGPPGARRMNLNQTFNLSIEIESIKGKIEVVEKGMKQLRNMIAKDRQKDKKKKKNK